MDKFIEAIVSGNFEAIYTLLSSMFNVGIGTALIFVARRFLKYKKSVEEVATKTEEKVNDVLVPTVKELGAEIKVEILDELRADVKILAESMALLTNNDPNSKIAIINNVSKIGASKEVVEIATTNVEEEVKAEEEHQEAIKETIQALEENKIETL